MSSFFLIRFNSVACLCRVLWGFCCGFCVLCVFGCCFCFCWFSFALHVDSSMDYVSIPFSSPFDAHCRHDDVATALIRCLCKMQLAFRLDKRPGKSHMALDGKKISEAWPRPRLGRKTYWHKDKARLMGTRNYIILLLKSQQGWTWSSWQLCCLARILGRSWRRGPQGKPRGFKLMEIAAKQRVYKMKQSWRQAAMQVSNSSVAGPWKLEQNPSGQASRQASRASSLWKLKQNNMTKKGPFFGPQNVRKSRRAKMGLPSSLSYRLTLPSSREGFWAGKWRTLGIACCFVHFGREPVVVHTIVRGFLSWMNLFETVLETFEIVSKGFGTFEIVSKGFELWFLHVTVWTCAFVRR